MLGALEVLALAVCLSLTGAAVLAPEHGWLQLVASAACAGFGWFFGLPPATVLARLLARMRPERLAQVVSAAARSMPPERAAVVLGSLQPPPSSPAPAPVPVVFDRPEDAPPPKAN